MIYVIKDKVGKLVAFSERLDYIYHYLVGFYKRDFVSLYNYEPIYNEKGEFVKLESYKSDKKIELTITEIKDEDKCCDLYYDYEEFQIQHFYGDLLLTSWECDEYYFMLEKYRIDLYDYAKMLAKKNLGKIYDKIDDADIREYMKRTLGNKYDSLINQKRFMNELGSDKICELVNGVGLTYHDVYYMGMEYKRKISDTNR